MDRLSHQPTASKEIVIGEIRRTLWKLLEGHMDGTCISVRLVWDRCDGSLVTLEHGNEEQIESSGTEVLQNIMEVVYKHYGEDVNSLQITYHLSYIVIVVSTISGVNKVPLIS